MNVDLREREGDAERRTYSKNWSEIDSKEFCLKKIEKSKVSILSD